MTGQRLGFELEELRAQERSRRRELAERFGEGLGSSGVQELQEIQELQEFRSYRSTTAQALQVGASNQMSPALEQRPKHSVTPELLLTHSSPYILFQFVR